MNKGYYKRLMQHAESCQMEADQTAYQMAIMLDEISLLAAVQSICDFNLFWLAGISPVIVYNRSLYFFANHKSEFKRKLSIAEIIEFDWIIAHNDISSMEEFKIHLNRSRSNSRIDQLSQPSTSKPQRAKKQNERA